MSDLVPDVMGATLWAREALLQDGRKVPITNMFDDDGVETTDPAEVCSFVCGPVETAAGEKWLSVDVRAWQRVGEQ